VDLTNQTKKPNKKPNNSKKNITKMLIEYFNNLIRKLLHDWLKTLPENTDECDDRGFTEHQVQTWEHVYDSLFEMCQHWNTICEESGGMSRRGLNELVPSFSQHHSVFLLDPNDSKTITQINTNILLAKQMQFSKFLSLTSPERHPLMIGLLKESCRLARVLQIIGDKYDQADEAWVRCQTILESVNFSVHDLIENPMCLAALLPQLGSRPDFNNFIEWFGANVGWDIAQKVMCLMDLPEPFNTILKRAQKENGEFDGNELKSLFSLEQFSEIVTLPTHENNPATTLPNTPTPSNPWKNQVENLKSNNYKNNNNEQNRNEKNGNSQNGNEQNGNKQNGNEQNGKNTKNNKDNIDNKNNDEDNNNDVNDNNEFDDNEDDDNEDDDNEDDSDDNEEDNTKTKKPVPIKPSTSKLLKLSATNLELMKRLEKKELSTLSMKELKVLIQLQRQYQNEQREIMQEQNLKEARKQQKRERLEKELLKLKSETLFIQHNHSTPPKHRGENIKLTNQDAKIKTTEPKPLNATIPEGKVAEVKVPKEELPKAEPRKTEIPKGSIHPDIQNMASGFLSQMGIKQEEHCSFMDMLGHMPEFDGLNSMLQNLDLSKMGPMPPMPSMPPMEENYMGKMKMPSIQQMAAAFSIKQFDPTTTTPPKQKSASNEPPAPPKPRQTKSESQTKEQRKENMDSVD
jgi:hypothetical protein